MEKQLTELSSVIRSLIETATEKSYEVERAFNRFQDTVNQRSQVRQKKEELRLAEKLDRLKQDKNKGVFNLAKELISVGLLKPGDPGYDSPDYHSKFIGTWNVGPQERAREIGNALNELGGLEAMRQAAYKIKDTMGDIAATELEHCWHGIGDWMA